MSCKCGGNCGPIILQPEIVLPEQSPGDINVDVTDYELEILCDTAGPFLRRYSVDPDGNVTTIDTELDGTTPYTAIAPIGVCGPDAAESPGELGVHCVTLRIFDDGQPFLRTICHDSEGNIVSVTDTDLDGNDYIVVGEVTTCCPDDESPGELISQQAVVLCDDDIEFIRTYTLTGGQVSGFADTDLDGGAYTTVGTVGVCPLDVESPAECGNTEVLVLCDMRPDGTSVQFLRQLVTDCDGSVVSVNDAELDGNTPYTTTGDVGVCPTVTEPLEIMPACDDTDGDGIADTKYVIIYRLDPTGQIDPTPIGTYLPDLSAPYTPVSPVVCDPCPDPIVPPEGEPVATDSSERCPRPEGSPTTAFPGSAQTLWDGGTLAIPADPDASAGNGTAVNRSVVAFLQADRPMCDNGQVEVSVSVQACNTGTNPTEGYAGAICGYTGDCADELLPHAFLDAPVGPGECQTLTSTWVLAAQDLADNGLRVELDVQTFSPAGGTSWELSDFQAEYQFMTEGCADPENGLGCCEEEVQKVALCEPISIRHDENEQRCASVITHQRCDDTDGDGIGDTCYTELLCVSPSGTVRLLHTYQDTPMGLYTPTNPVPCTSPGAPVAIPLDTVGPAPASGTLDNGVAWDVNIGQWLAAPAVPTSFYGFRPVDGQQVWMFNQPVQMRFGISNVNNVDAPGAEECVQLPAGVVVESIDPNHDWDPATGMLCANQNDTTISELSTFTYAGTELMLTAVNDDNAFRGVAFIEVAAEERCCGCTSGGDAPAEQAEVVTCGLPPDAVTSGETNSGAVGEMQAVDTPTSGVNPMSGANSPAHVPLPGGGQSLWDGGTLVFPAEPDASGGDGIQVYRQVAAQLIAARPGCDNGTVQVDVSVQVTNDGPSDVFLYGGGLALANKGTRVDVDLIELHAPVGLTQTLTVSAVVPAADLDAGNITVELSAETFHIIGKQWTADQFTASYAYNVEGCAEEVPSIAVRFCEPITVKYEPPPVGGGGDSCTSTTVTLCDTGGGTGGTGSIPLDTLPDAPPAQSGTLANGVDWSVDAGTYTAASGAYVIPGDTTQAWTFSEPVQLRFGIASLNQGSGADRECVQLPVGVVLETLHPNHSWDAATRTVCNIDIGDQHQPDESIFVIDVPTSSLNIAALGLPAENRGPSFIEVTPDTAGGLTRFLRTYTFDCDGTVTGVTDTDFDGLDYDVLGEVTQCASDSGSPAPVPTGVSTGITRLTGAATEDVAAAGVLQSATVTVISGEADVTTASGTATVPAGISLTWSVAKDADEELDVLSVTTAADSDAIAHWTVK